jgi:methionine-rich copper-binding protein CopC
MNARYVLTTAVLTFSSSFAFAHAHIKSATPAKDATVTQAPKEVEVEFSMPLEASMSKIEVKKIPSGEVVTSGPVASGKEKSSLVAPLRPLTKADAGKYEVKYKAVSSDTHKMDGHYEFTFAPKE